MNTLTPASGLMLESDVSSQEEGYNAWLRTEISERLVHPGRLIPHDEVMAEIDVLIEEIEASGRR